MSNHYHLLVETPDANLSVGMRQLREVPQVRARPIPKPLSHFAQQCADRDSAIVAAYASGGCALNDIGDYFGLDYSRVSKIVRLAEHGPPKEKGKT
nr:hypothetical protein [Candidatus Accumulibacter aalborgensis]